MSTTLRKVAPCLWFDDQAEDAARFYTSIFDNSRIGRISRYGKEGFEIHGRPEGSVMTVEFEIEGHSFTALNGGPAFTFNEAISFQVSCQSQEEVDYFWASLGEGGEEGPCGWLKDKFGVSWQIVPDALIDMINDPDREKSERVTRAMFQMSKIDIEGLRTAHDR